MKVCGHKEGASFFGNSAPCDIRVGNLGGGERDHQGTGILFFCFFLEMGLGVVVSLTSDVSIYYICFALLR